MRRPRPRRPSLTLTLTLTLIGRPCSRPPDGALRGVSAAEDGVENMAKLDGERERLQAEMEAMGRKVARAGGVAVSAAGP